MSTHQAMAYTADFSNCSIDALTCRFAHRGCACATSHKVLFESGPILGCRIQRNCDVGRFTKLSIITFYQLITKYNFAQ